MCRVGDRAGGGARDGATTVVANGQRRPDGGSFAGLWSTVLLFIGATAVFARLQTALNLIFHSDARQLSGPWAWLRKRVLSFGVVLALGFLLIVSMSLTTALQVVFAWLPSILPVLGDMTSRSEEHTSELQSLMRISYAVFCLKNKKIIDNKIHT